MDGILSTGERGIVFYAFRVHFHVSDHAIVLLNIKILYNNFLHLSPENL